MSDPLPPPKPKPGSLRDRIAAFETKPAAQPSVPPPIRPKPGGISWKPKVPSPPSSPNKSGDVEVASHERKVAGVGGMSASDAKESIGKGGSLKERMAALQGKGAFGAPVPTLASKPALEKPKWKPPPVVSPPAEEADNGTVKASGEPEVVKSPEESHGEPVTQNESREEETGHVVGDENEPDPEEEERQRRANIAARMARLGGARVGMTPPVYGRKPEVKRPSQEDTTTPQPSAEGTHSGEPISVPLVQSPAVEKPIEAAEPLSITDLPERKESASSDLSIESSSSTAARSPSSMPIPAVPRRAGPPRKKAFKSPSPAQSVDIVDEASKGTPPPLDLTAPIETPADEPAIAVGAQIDQVIQQNPDGIVTEADIQKLPENDQDDVVSEMVDIVAAGPEQNIVEHEVLASPAAHVDAQPEYFPPVAFAEERQTELAGADEHTAPSPSVEVMEEDEATRRQRISDRVAKMGGFNPFGAPPPLTSPGAVSTSRIGGKPSRQGSGASERILFPTSAGVERRSSIRKDSAGSIAASPVTSIGLDTSSRMGSPPVEEIVGVSPPPARKSSEFASSDGSDIPTLEGDFSQHVDMEEIQDDPQEETESEFKEVESVSFVEEDAGNDDVYFDIESASHGLYGNEISVPLELEQDPVYISADQEDGVVEIQEDTEVLEAEYTYEDAQTGAAEQEEPKFAPPPPPRSRPLPTPPHDFRSNDDSEKVSFEATHSNVAHRASLRGSIPPPSRELPISQPDNDVENAAQAIPSRSIPLTPPAEEEAEEEEDFAEEREAHMTIPTHPEDASEGAEYILAEESLETGEEIDEESAPPPPRRSTTLPKPTVHGSGKEHSPPLRPSRPSVSSTAKHETKSNPDTPSTVSSRRSMPSPPGMEQASGRPRPQLLDFSGAEREILDDADGDPIDPTFHSPRSPVIATSRSSLPAPPQPDSTREDDAEYDRRRTIAERMAKLGGIKFGAMPAVARPPPSVPHLEEDSIDQSISQEDQPDEVEDDEEEERARKQRIAAKLAGMGGMRFGMLPPIVHPRTGSDQSVATVKSIPSKPILPPPVLPSLETDIESESHSASDDGVKVEADESELEEVTYEDAVEAEDIPAVPSRAGRRSASSSSEPQTVESVPPLPTGRRTSQITPSGPPAVPIMPAGTYNRRSSVQTPTSAARKTSSDIPSSPVPRPPASDYVMVDEPESDAPPPPPPRPSRGGAPSRTSSRPPVERSQPTTPWELPSIPSGSFDLGKSTDLSMSMSTWSDDSTSYPMDSPALSVPPPPPPAILTHPLSASQSASRTAKSSDPEARVDLSADELVAVWGRVGIHVCEIATSFLEKSKKALIGDGSYMGFVNAVLEQVSSAARPVPPSYGQLIYSQTGTSVHRRSSEIMPGDIIVLSDAKFKGHKGLQSYHQSIGVDEPVVGIVGEFEPKKSKVRIFQANQHVGQQTVETVSYRLEDLKSGYVKVFRVLQS